MVPMFATHCEPLAFSIHTGNRRRKIRRSRVYPRNTGRKPACAIPEETKDKVFNLYNTKYDGANFAHFTELLEKHEGTKLSVSSCRNILEERNVFSPHMTKAKRKRIKKTLRESLNTAKSVREKQEIQDNLVALENAHSRRPRVKYFGELIQMDASSFEWVPGQIWHLRAAIDDATNTIVGLWFDWQETLSGYYHVLSQILSNMAFRRVSLRTIGRYSCLNGKTKRR